MPSGNPQFDEVICAMITAFRAIIRAFMVSSGVEDYSFHIIPQTDVEASKEIINLEQAFQNPGTPIKSTDAGPLKQDTIGTNPLDDGDLDEGLAGISSNKT